MIALFSFQSHLKVDTFTRYFWEFLCNFVIKSVMFPAFLCERLPTKPRLSHQS